MSTIFGSGVYQDNSDIVFTDTFNEAVLYDSISHLSEDAVDEFLSSDQAEAMLEEGMVSRRTLVRLSKNDDLSRRTTIAAMELAKKANDSLWKQLVKVNKKKKTLVATIVKKYGAKAATMAKKSQKEFIKDDKSFFSKSGATQALKTANTAMKVSSDKKMGRSKWLSFDKKAGGFRSKEKVDED